MENVLKISELISTDVRSRYNAGIIRSAMDGLEGDIVLDFTEVTFISRSFTDELCTIVEKHQNIKIVNTIKEVKSMIDAVTSGRKQKRKRIKDDSEIKEFTDIESLTSFLATI